MKHFDVDKKCFSEKLIIIDGRSIKVDGIHYLRRIFKLTALVGTSQHKYVAAKVPPPPRPQTLRCPGTAALANSSLTYLNLAENLLCRRGAEALAGGLRRSATLERLVLRDNRVKEDCAKGKPCGPISVILR